jgi:hypothetical protein
MTSQEQKTTKRAPLVVKLTYVSGFRYTFNLSKGNNPDRFGSILNAANSMAEEYSDEFKPLFIKEYSGHTYVQVSTTLPQSIRMKTPLKKGQLYEIEMSIRKNTKEHTVKVVTKKLKLMKDKTEIINDSDEEIPL